MCLTLQLSECIMGWFWKRTSSATYSKRRIASQQTCLLLVFKKVVNTAVEDKFAVWSDNVQWPTVISKAESRCHFTEDCLPSLAAVFSGSWVCYLSLPSSKLRKNVEDANQLGKALSQQIRKNSNSFFVKSLFSKGIQNRSSTVFIEVIPVLVIEPKAVTRSVGKYSILIGMQWLYSLPSEYRYLTNSFPSYSTYFPVSFRWSGNV